MTYEIVKEGSTDIYADAVVKRACTGSSEIVYSLSDEPGSGYYFTADAEKDFENLLSECVKIVGELGLESLAIPVSEEKSISGAVSYVIDKLSDSDIRIILIADYDHETDLPQNISSGIDEYLMSKLDVFEDMNFALKEDEDAAPEENALMPSAVMGAAPMAAMSCAAAGMPLDERVKHLSDTWQELLLNTIDLKGYTDAEVYKKANVDRKLFSKIRSNPSYQPKKITAVAFALALELNLDESRDFLARAGYAFSESSVFDLIIMYFIENKVFDIYQINLALFEHDQPTIGG